MAVVMIGNISMGEAWRLMRCYRWEEEIIMVEKILAVFTEVGC